MLADILVHTSRNADYDNQTVNNSKADYDNQTVNNAYFIIKLAKKYKKFGIIRPTWVLKLNKYTVVLISLRARVLNHYPNLLIGCANSMKFTF